MTNRKNIDWPQYLTEQKPSGNTIVDFCNEKTEAIKHLIRKSNSAYHYGMKKVLIFAVVLLAGCVTPDTPVENAETSKKQDTIENASESVLEPLKYEHREPELQMNLLVDTPTLFHAQIKSIDVSPDGKYFISGGTDNIVRLWNIKTGSLIRSFSSHKADILGVSYSKSGHFIATLSIDGTIKIWNVHSGDEVRSYEFGDSYIEPVNSNNSMYSVFSAYGALSFSRDDKFILASGEYNETILLEASTGKTVWKISETAGDLCFSNNGEYAALAARDEVLIVESATGTIISRLPVEGLAVDFNPKDSLVVTGDGEGYVKVWDVKTEELIHTFLDENEEKASHSGKVYSVQFSSDGTYIVSAGEENYLKLWDAGTRELVRIYSRLDRIASSYSDILSVYFTDSGILTGSAKSTLRLWNSGTGHHIREYALFQPPDETDSSTDNIRQVFLDGIPFSPAGIEVWSELWQTACGTNMVPVKSRMESSSSIPSPDGKNILYGEYSGDVYVHDTEKNAVITRFTDENLHEYDSLNRAHLEKVTGVLYSPDGKQIVTAAEKEKAVSVESKDCTLKLWDAETGRLIRYFYQKNEYKLSIDIACPVFSPSGKYLAAADNGNYVYLIVWDTETGKQVWRHRFEKAKINSILYSDNGESIFCGLSNGKIALISAETGEETESIDAHDESITATAVSAHYIVTGSSDRTIKLWDMESLALIKTLPPFSEIITETAVFPNEQYVYGKSADGTRRIIEIESENYVNFNTLGSEWIAYTPDGYWDASPGGKNLVTMSRDLDVWNMDQFALKYNRPDILLQRLGSSDTDLMNHYYNQYAKRLRRFGITEAELESAKELPAAQILEYSQDDKYINLTTVFSGSSLETYNVYVNDVPVYSPPGKKITGSSVTADERIELTYGSNKIEVSCFNTYGIESYRDFINAAYDTEVTGDLYFLGFGVSNYEDKNLNLRYADKDASDLKNLFSTMQGRYGKIYTRIYTDTEVTTENIKNAKWFIENARVDDTFVLFIAGHGLHDEDSTYYYLTYNADLNNLKGTAADFNLIEDLLEGINPRKKIFLMDTCESGIQDDETRAYYASTAGSRGLEPRAITRGLQVIGRNRGIRIPIIRNSRFIYSDIFRRSGSIVFSSSRGNEFSYEDEKYENGLFTEKILEAFKDFAADTDKDGSIAIYELVDYVSESVGVASNELQHPVVDRDNIYQKFGIDIKPRPFLTEVFVQGGPVPGRFPGTSGEQEVRSFFISAYEITRYQYSPGYSYPAEEKNLPTGAGFLDAIDFCNRLSRRYGYEEVYYYDEEGRIQCDSEASGFRLPTAAEWCFAACGGNKSKNYAYSGSDNPDEVAWYKNNSDGRLHPVGLKKPNELGIYDMSGNAAEFLWSRFPYGPWANTYNARTQMGGKCTDDAEYVRPNIISDFGITGWYPNTGFRVVRNGK